LSTFVSAVAHQQFVVGLILNIAVGREQIAILADSESKVPFKLKSQSSVMAL